MNNDRLQTAIRAVLFLGMAGGGTSAWSDTLPAGLLPVLYDKIAGDAASKSPTPLQHGCGDLASQKMHACFTSTGARFHSRGNGTLQLELTAIGRGPRLDSVGAVTPDFSKTGVEYRHPGVTEWWRSLPVGYEQGFTIPRRPAGRGRLSLQLASSRPPEEQGGDLVWQRIHYGDLEVYDARRQRLPAKFEVSGDHIAIRVDDRGARYPLTVDPLVWVQQKDAANDGAKNDHFGYAIAVGGNTVAVGAPFAKIGSHSTAGAVYLFTDSNGIWTQSAKLTAAQPSAGAEFGAALAMTSTTLLVGAPFAGAIGCGTCSVNVVGSGPGAAYVFNNGGGGVWTQTQKLTPTDIEAVTGIKFGTSVSVSGTTLVVGAPSAIVFIPPGQPTSPPTVGDLGRQRKIKYRTDSATPSSSSGVNHHGLHEPLGAAYVFTQAGAQWNQVQKLAAFDVSSHGGFGQAVAISPTDIAVGAPFATAGATGSAGSVHSAGLAFVFTNSAAAAAVNAAPAPQASFAGPTGIGAAQFGFALALSGTSLAVGAPTSQVKHSFAAIGLSASSGSGNVISQNGSSAQGEVFMYGEVTVGSQAGTWNLSNEFLSRDGAPNNLFGYSLTFKGTSLNVGAPQAKFRNDHPQGEVYIFTQSHNGSWAAIEKLVAQDAVQSDSYGFAIAALGNTVIEGAPNAKVGANTKQGKVYFDTAETLAVSVTAPAVVSSGGASFVSNITVTNSAPTVSAPVTLSVTVPNGTRFISADTPLGTCGIVSTTVSCTLNGIAANGGSGVMHLTLATTGLGVISETANVANSKPAVSGNGSTFIQPKTAVKGGGGVDLWSLGALMWLLTLGLLDRRRRRSSG